MFCPKCGTQNKDGAKFCGKCGAPIAAPNQQNGQATQATSQTARPQAAKPQAARPVATAAPAASVQAASSGAGISRRTLFIGAGLGIVAIAGVAFGVTSCTGGALGGVSDVIPLTKEDGNATFTPFSTALANGRLIWYSASPTKSSIIIAAYVTENGQITRYKTYASADQSEYITLADLKDMSDDDIIEFLKETDQNVFENAKEVRASSADEKVASFESLIDDWDTKWTSRYRNLSADEVAKAYGWTLTCTPQEAAQKAMEKWQDIADSSRSLEYKEPEAYPYTVIVVTDGTGNAAQGERIAFSYLEMPEILHSGLEVETPWEDVESMLQYASEEYESTYSDFNNYTVSEDRAEEEETISFSSGDMVTGTVYDKTYFGLSNRFIAAAEEGVLGISLDTPDTEGVEVE